jgi:hypothetical protein
MKTKPNVKIWFTFDELKDLIEVYSITVHESEITKKLKNDLDNIMVKVQKTIDEENEKEMPNKERKKR